MIVCEASASPGREVEATAAVALQCEHWDKHSNTIGMHMFLPHNTST